MSRVRASGAPLRATKSHAKRLIEEWRIEYNTERPHSSLGYLTPVQFARAHDAKQQFLTSDSNCGSD
ncbi:integrase core domain-containing protein [Burkholderia cenocepacia]|uniref:integrase core domain-containing protein n=1 Tax=Burkholderia cenocepacia TaxID=95486 RepID=UPI00196B5421|nr:integrase core domain-containing protein [Burkholderia cenocepacia]MBN3534120.1 transposase [Burkholderia cenocepacia]MBO1859073.1 integrase core domain-containing protein [Burkholderia cenocepacia]MBR8029738.1 integrase core domain-containing protein [Burkholderia cenocepacia]MBR8172606.1 integrase core domain-containing protein [Burkholderia cenocepacia]MBR8426554.1 integrase core domain-containing protein [Burkholderia cenocepacia]